MTEKMRIECCLIGAPGVGKSDLANAFVKESQYWLVEHDLAPMRIIDTNDQIEERQGRHTGVYGDHYVTFQNYFNRAQEEDEARHDGHSLMSVGCLIDAMAHLNVRLKAVQKMVQTAETEAIAQREMMAGTLLQTYMMDQRWRVNYVWYVPLGPQIVIPGQAEQSYPAEVDAVLRDINVKMQLGIPVLEGGTTEERVAKMMVDLDKFFVGEEKADATVSN